MTALLVTCSLHVMREGSTLDVMLLCKTELLTQFWDGHVFVEVVFLNGTLKAWPMQQNGGRMSRAQSILFFKHVQRCSQTLSFSSVFFFSYNPLAYKGMANASRWGTGETCPRRPLFQTGRRMFTEPYFHLYSFSLAILKPSSYQSLLLTSLSIQASSPSSPSLQ